MKMKVFSLVTESVASVGKYYHLYIDSIALKERIVLLHSEDETVGDIFNIQI